MCRLCYDKQFIFSKLVFSLEDNTAVINKIVFTKSVSLFVVKELCN